MIAAKKYSRRAKVALQKRHSHCLGNLAITRGPQFCISMASIQAKGARVAAQLGAGIIVAASCHSTAASPCGWTCWDAHIDLLE